MNKNELIEAVAAEVGGTKADASRAVNSVFNNITKALSEGEEIRVIGFGTFYAVRREASTGRNPRTGEPIKIKASNQAKFRPGKELKDSINN